MKRNLDLVDLSQRPVMVLRGGFPELDPRLFALDGDVITCGRAATFFTCVCGFWIEHGCVLICGLSGMFAACGLHFYGRLRQLGTSIVGSFLFVLSNHQWPVVRTTHTEISPFLKRSFGTLSIPFTTSPSNSFLVMNSGPSTSSHVYTSSTDVLGNSILEGPNHENGS